MTIPAGAAPRPCHNILLCGIGLLACLLVGGCATHARRLAEPRRTFYTGDLPSAQQQLSKLSDKARHDKHALELDLAVVELINGDAASAEQRLRKVRDAWEHLEQKSLTEEATALLTDDRRRAYSGEDYEKILVRVFLTLCSLMQDGVDAESYSLQTLTKYEQLKRQACERWLSQHESELQDDLTSDSAGEPFPEQEFFDRLTASAEARGSSDPPAVGRQPPKDLLTLMQAYRLPAIAPYLRGVLREATLRDYDDAARAYQQAYQLQPEAEFIRLDLERALHGTHSKSGHGVVYVIALVGRGPYKIEVEEEATSEALLIADRIVSALGKYSVPPTIAPVKVPHITSPPRPFDILGVQINGAKVSTTLPISDLHTIAQRTFETKRSAIMARTIARRVLKKGAVYVAKDQLQASNQWASLALDAVGVLWEATESADTRCWGLLPREIQILRLELPTGVHRLAMEPLVGGNSVAPAHATEVRVNDGRNTFVLSYWPDTQPIGSILTSQ